MILINEDDHNNFILCLIANSYINEQLKTFSASFLKALISDLTHCCTEPFYCIPVILDTGIHKYWTPPTWEKKAGNSFITGSVWLSFCRNFCIEPYLVIEICSIYVCRMIFFFFIKKINSNNQYCKYTTLIDDQSIILYLFYA